MTIRNQNNEDGERKRKRERERERELGNAVDCYISLSFISFARTNIQNEETS